MTIQVWDHENDCLVLDRPSLFRSGEEYTARPCGVAYCVKAENGSFYQVEHRFRMRYSLMFYDGKKETMIMDNIIVVASDLNCTFMMIYEVETGYLYIIDTRGIIYGVGTMEPKLSLGLCEFRVNINKQTGFYDIGTKGKPLISIRYMDKMKSLMLYMETAARIDAEINPKFKSFFRKKDTISYLYLTYTSKKKKAVIEYLLNQGIDYETVPNLMIDDDSKNIRIPLTEKNLNKEGVQFMVAKYDNGYSIYNIPIETYIAYLDMDYKYRAKFRLRVSQGSEKRGKEVMKTLNTLRQILASENDVELFKDIFKKIVVKLDPKIEMEENNRFYQLLITTPRDVVFEDMNRYALMNKLSYIQELGFDVTLESIKKLDAIALNKFMIEVVKKAHDNYKAAIDEYEKDILAKAGL